MVVSEIDSQLSWIAKDSTEGRGLVALATDGAKMREQIDLLDSFFTLYPDDAWKEERKAVVQLETYINNLKEERDQLAARIRELEGR